MKIQKNISKIVALFMAMFMLCSTLPLSVYAASANVSYRAHVSDIGWQNFKSGGTTAGTTGQSKAIEAIEIKLSNCSGNISYSSHLADIGWTSYVSNGATSGTTGQSRAMEAIRIKLTGSVANSYDIQYRVHVQDIGWMPWVSNNEIAGTTGRSLRMEAIEIKLVSKNTSNIAYVNTQSTSLLLRKTASTSGTIIAKMPKGAQITVLNNKAQTNGFYNVKYNNVTGYASASYITFTKPTSASSASSSSGSLIANNLSKVKLIKQGSKTCKATAVAQSLNIIEGANNYTTASLGNVPCTNISGRIYKGSDGYTYKATYKQDTYRGSASEQMQKINEALANGLPIVVAVRKTTSGTQRHWVTVIGRNGNTYDIIDPATGTKRTMANAGYSFGRTNIGHSGLFYGYISFTRQ